MKVYIAAPFPWKLTAIKAAFILEDAGFKVTSRWLDEDTPANAKLSDLSDEQKAFTAQLDLDDIDAADVLIQLSGGGPPYMRPGHVAETWYAHAKGKQIVIIGSRQTIFDYLPAVRWFDSFLEAKKYLVDLREEQGSVIKRPEALSIMQKVLQPVSVQHHLPAQQAGDSFAITIPCQEGIHAE